MHPEPRSGSPRSSVRSERSWWRTQPDRRGRCLSGQACGSETARPVSEIEATQAAVARVARPAQAIAVAAVVTWASPPKTAGPTPYRVISPDASRPNA